MCEDQDLVTKLRGHLIHLNSKNEWVYTDTGEPTKDNWRDRPCGKCGHMPTAEGHDPCLGTLPGVINACCGHGDVRYAYVMFEDKSTLRYQDAITWFQKHKGL